MISSTSSAVEILADATFPGTLREACELWMLKEFLPEGSSAIPLECRLVSSLTLSETV